MFRGLGLCGLIVLCSTIGLAQEVDSFHGRKQRSVQQPDRRRRGLAQGGGGVGSDAEHHAQRQRADVLWESPRIFLLTMGPGEHLFTRFGHSAFLVEKKARSALVYNYGYTDFSDPHLIFKFLRGEALFWSVVESLGRTLYLYEREDRSVSIQPLQLEDHQAQKLAALLEKQAGAGQHKYRYHHYKDNCTTRLRDLLDQVTSGAVKKQLQGKWATRKTWRDLTREGFAGEIGLLILLDLVVGRTIDHHLDMWEATFLPSFLSRAVSQIHLRHERNGPLEKDHNHPSSWRLAPPPRPLYKRHGPSFSGRDPLLGVKLLWCIAGVVAVLSISMLIFVRRRSRWAGIAIAFPALFIGACGALIWGLAVFSSLPEIRFNELLLILWPTDLALLWTAVKWCRGKIQPGRLMKSYSAVRTLVVVLACIGHIFGLLYQKPRVWIVIAFIWAVSLLIAAWCKRCNRTVTAASSS